MFRKDRFGNDIISKRDLFNKPFFGENQQPLKIKHQISFADTLPTTKMPLERIHCVESFKLENKLGYQT